jgi:hypothetical protein
MKVNIVSFGGLVSSVLIAHMAHGAQPAQIGKYDC